jgi:hypothetical protein
MLPSKLLAAALAALLVAHIDAAARELKQTVGEGLG